MRLSAAERPRVFDRFYHRKGLTSPLCEFS